MQIVQQNFRKINKLTMYMKLHKENKPIYITNGFKPTMSE